MFTGLIEEVGAVKEIRRGQLSATLTLTGRTVLEQVEIGDSMAVNGVCLTVTRFDSGSFSVDVMYETMIKTNLARLQVGSRVNLERALRVGDRLGGHLVTGHIDATARVLQIKERGNAKEIWIELANNLESYLVPQGSIAVDGVSLTVAELRRGAFMVSLIPHTRAVSRLGDLRSGDLVNLETDLLGKYVNRMLGRGGGGISTAFLAENGFC